jgi:hypothetical protein
VDGLVVDSRKIEMTDEIFKLVIARFDFFVFVTTQTAERRGAFGATVAGSPSLLACQGQYVAGRSSGVLGDPEEMNASTSSGRAVKGLKTT